jgi:uncharacterized protein
VKDTDAPLVESKEPGRLAENLLLFCRTLRRAGLPLGPGRIIDALFAARMTGLQRRDDLYWALRAILVTDPAQIPLFHQAFLLYFHNPHLLERLRSLLLADTQEPPQGAAARRTVRRLLEAMEREAAGEPGDDEADRSLSWSRREVLRAKDFEQMSLAELAEAKEVLRTEILPMREAATRRFQPSGHGHRYDLRRSLKLMMQNNGQLVELAKKRRSERPPALVLLCDISGSMSRYSRVFLHFAHALRTQNPELHAFVFATRLTNISRRLADRDCDQALAEVTAAVSDWDGGTRIADCLERFNVDWSRRVLARDAVVILLSDGLERDSDANLEFQVQRLKRSCRQLIWLNPVLRYVDFEPKAAGIRAMLPHVDLFLPAHNVDSLSALCQVLGRAPVRSGRPPDTRLRAAS